MKIHHLRNATIILEAAGEKILVDPMLGGKGTLPPFSFLRNRLALNPTVPLPANAPEILSSVTAGLITHCQRGHKDHLDGEGVSFLASRGIPVYATPDDAKYLSRRGIKAKSLPFSVSSGFFGGTILPVPATHGHGWIGKLMGPGVGYVIRFPGEPGLYLSGDTVLTDRVRQVLRDEKPGVAVVHAGGARLDVGAPILMTVDEVLEFIRLSPGIVVANHLEALNHCPTTRQRLRSRVESAGLASRVMIPADGESVGPL
ncbi:MAG: MBL fold metallo-hydrolase [Bdellovibrionota bacterium]